MKKMQVTSDIEGIKQIEKFIDDELEAIGCPVKIQTQVDIAVDEIASNICNYAYNEKPGMIVAEFNFEGSSGVLSVDFIDTGKQFNPLENKDPDVTLPLEERQIGGLGIFIVKKIMDDVLYEYREGKNILTIRKKIQ